MNDVRIGSIVRVISDEKLANNLAIGRNAIVTDCDDYIHCIEVYGLHRNEDVFLKQYIKEGEYEVTEF